LLELGYTLRLSCILVDEHTPRGRVKLQLRNILARLQGTPNTILDRKLRGRLRKDPTPTQTTTV
jgi:hypothetical protein